jgi:hypothetical protein
MEKSTSNHGAPEPSFVQASGLFKFVPAEKPLKEEEN